MVEKLPDDAKVELAKRLKEVEAASRKVRRCLLVQLDGFGRMDPHTVRAAWEEYESAREVADEVASDEVRPVGLFREEAAR